jgi:hypothetical protein
LFIELTNDNYLQVFVDVAHIQHKFQHINVAAPSIKKNGA